MSNDKPEYISIGGFISWFSDTTDTLKQLKVIFYFS